MSWVKFDDQFNNHPKILAAGPLAQLLYMKAIVYCGQYLTDGFIPAAAVDQLFSPGEGLGFFLGDANYALEIDPRDRIERVTALDAARTLVECGLWIEAETKQSESKGEAKGGWFVHDYLDWNPSRAKVEEKRREISGKKASAGRKGGVMSGKSRRSKKKANTQAKAKQNEAPSPSPSPSPKRDIEFFDDEEIPPHRVEQIGFPRYGQLGGTSSLKVSRLCPIFGWELRKSMATPGKSWAYFAKVVESIREEAAKPKPPAGGRKAQLHYVAPLDGNGIPIPRPQESAK